MLRRVRNSAVGPQSAASDDAPAATQMAARGRHFSGILVTVPFSEHLEVMRGSRLQCLPGSIPDNVIVDAVVYRCGCVPCT
jgi:hypothetical protein